MNGMFMIGNGTETDPYIIEDIFDLCAVEDDADKEVTYYKIKDNVNLDFNNHPNYKDGLKTWNIIRAPKSVIDGNGREIRNMVVYSTNSNAPVFTFKQISNCKFPNLITFSTYGKIFSCEFIRCSFFVSVLNGSVTQSLTESTFYKCTLTITGKNSDEGAMIGSKISYSNVIFKDFTLKIVNFSYFGYAYLLSGAFDHVYFTGKMNIINNSPILTRYVTASNISNCYWAVECDPSGGNPEYNDKAFYLNQGNATSSFYDKDLISNSNCQSIGTTFALSTSECKKTSELINIGFPVVAI